MRSQYSKRSYCLLLHASTSSRPAPHVHPGAQTFERRRADPAYLEQLIDARKPTSAPAGQNAAGERRTNSGQADECRRVRSVQVDESRGLTRGIPPSTSAPILPAFEHRPGRGKLKQGRQPIGGGRPDARNRLEIGRAAERPVRFPIFHPGPSKGGADPWKAVEVGRRRTVRVDAFPGLERPCPPGLVGLDRLRRGLQLRRHIRKCRQGVGPCPHTIGTPPHPCGEEHERQGTSQGRALTFGHAGRVEPGVGRREGRFGPTPVGSAASQPGQGAGLDQELSEYGKLKLR